MFDHNFAKVQNKSMVRILEHTPLKLLNDSSRLRTIVILVMNTKDYLEQ
jgi:hypothetical protein